MEQYWVFSGRRDRSSSYKLSTLCGDVGSIPMVTALLYDVWDSWEWTNIERQREFIWAQVLNTATREWAEIPILFPDIPPPYYKIISPDAWVWEHCYTGKLRRG